MSFVVKRGKNREQFDPEKLKKSLYKACISVHESKEAAQKHSKEVVESTTEWQKNKNEILSDDVRKFAGKKLEQKSSHAGYLYLHHRIMW